MENITLLDYFAAHAPEIPDWFIYEEQNKPKKPNRFYEEFGINSTNPDKEIIIEYYNEESETFIPSFYKNFESETIERIESALKKFNEDWEKYYNESSNYEIKQKINKLVNWRFFYANNMIAKSKINN